MRIKLLLIILPLLFVLTSSCIRNSVKIRPDAPENEGRIVFKEVANRFNTRLYIVEIDSVEYLVNEVGGIVKLE